MGERWLMRTARLIQGDPYFAWQLDEGIHTIGRKRGCNVCLECSSVSREHARLEFKNRAWYLQDLGSANGTLVNGVPSAAAVRVRHGDRLQFGDRMLWLELEDDATLAGTPNTKDSGTDTILSKPATRPVIMVVADLEGFTLMSSGMESSELAENVRDWCNSCRKILTDHGACLDKFIGDSVFAWWQNDGPDLRCSALSAARAITSIPSKPGFPPFHCGAALHCGEVALCRLPDNSHTLLGAKVNTTFRMQSLTRRLKQPLLVSSDFASNYPAGDTNFTPCGAHHVKGLPDPIEVFTPNLVA